MSLHITLERPKTSGLITRDQAKSVAQLANELGPHMGNVRSSLEHLEADRHDAIIKQVNHTKMLQELLYLAAQEYLISQGFKRCYERRNQFDPKEFSPSHPHYVAPSIGNKYHY